jgi:hypothetical protein
MNWILLPPWSLRLIAAAAVALAILAVWRWRRERRGGGLLALRLLLLACLLALTLNPHALLPRDRPAKRRLAVLVDTSASMDTRDVGGQPRLRAALDVIGSASTLDAWSRAFTLEFHAFDRARRRADPSLLAGGARGEATELGSALMSAVTEQGDLKEQAGVLVVSDGRATSPGALDAAQLALARSVPLWTWCLGGPVPRYDLRFDTASSEALAFSGAEVELVATLHAEGYSNRSFRVEILCNDRTVDTRDVLPTPEGLARVATRVKAPAAGEERWLFRTPPQPEEADTSNNERVIFLRTVGDKARVLLAEGQPHWDTKFLVQTLKRDPHIDLTALYRIQAGRTLAVLSATGAETRVEQDLFPRTAATMNAFDVIILGRGAESFFDAGTEALLTDFVARRAGSLIFARGKAYGGRFQPLAKLEPLAWGEGVRPGLRLKPTASGRDNPIFDLGGTGGMDDLLERLPALDQASATLGEKPLAVVLAAAAGRDGPALIAYQRYGQGKALCLNASGIWRWSFREAGQSESEAAYQRFWISLLQWLLAGQQFLPGADVALTSARRHYTSEEPMQFLITTRELDLASYQPRLTLEGDGRSFDILPRPRGGTFVAEAGPFPPGTYRVILHNNIGRPAKLVQSIQVVSDSAEKRELSADPTLMSRLAEISGGLVIQTPDVAGLPGILQRWESARQIAHRQQPLWDRGWILALLIALLGIEWWWRRKAGFL